MEVLTLPAAVDFTEDVSHCVVEDPDEDLACQVLVGRIETELRAAKARHMNGKNIGEVLLPSGLLYSVAGDILTAARDEPCGLRGCVLYIDYMDESQREKKRVGKVVCDPYTVNTFELHLTLRPETSWTFKLPQFLRNLANRSTMVISPDYSITKKQLYRSF